MKIFSVTDPEFKPYGRVVTGLNTAFVGKIDHGALVSDFTTFGKRNRCLER